ncbi:uncharacterized protein ZBIST_4197 [Zygosaccharomyces bailii]|nr:uncharacterized protein ZBIST_4197 [Zygosaccharomyces bailii]
MSRDNNSPRSSLQAKNTKNLSLDIRHVQIDPLPLPLPLPQPKPVGLESRFRKPQLASRRSEASIYTSAPSIRGAARPTRVHSLSVRTAELDGPGRARSQSLASTPLQEPREPPKQAWVFAEDEKKTESDSEQPDAGGSPEVGNAYPEGPLCVIPPCVFLYSEPTVQQVRSFELVINVAEEVADLEPHARERGVEYVRVPWAHSSQIAGDLMQLTERIHSARQQGRRVLVHCQCGVSRSASLVVAYIMRYERVSMNEAYTRLKGVARDISPNLGLVFQLMEWGEALSGGSSASSSQETTPRSPGEYFKSSLSSASSNSTESTLCHHDARTEAASTSAEALSGCE